MCAVFHLWTRPQCGKPLAGVFVQAFDALGQLVKYTPERLLVWAVFPVAVATGRLARCVSVVQFVLSVADPEMNVTLVGDTTRSLESTGMFELNTLRVSALNGDKNRCQTF